MKTTNFLALIVVATLFLALSTPVLSDFTADFVVRGSIANGGLLRGTVEYSYSSRAFRFKYEGVNLYSQEFHYNPSRGYDNFTQQYMYESATGPQKICGKCQVSAVRGTMPPLEDTPAATHWSPDGTITNPLDQRVCNKFKSLHNNTNKNQPIYVSLDSSKKACHFEFHNGRQFWFQNVVTPSTALAFPVPTNCVCQKRLDLTLMLDGSTSINAAEWNIVNTFVRNMAASFQFSPDAASLSITEYWGSSKNILPITDVKTTIDQFLLTTMPRFGSGTNVAAAINIVKDEVFLLRRQGAIPVVITLTDGADQSSPAVIRSKIAELAAVGVQNFISIYVGTEGLTRVEQMLALAGDNPQRTFKYDNFEAFGLAIKEINAAACDLDITEGNDCGQGCCGFCACSKCISPLECDDGLACTTEKLAPVPGTDLSCCTVPTPKVCTPGSLCNVSSCVEATGQCVDTPKDCKRDDPCYTYGCDTTNGCTKSPVCVSNDKCIIASCSPSPKRGALNTLADICVFTNMTCPPDDACTKYHCKDGTCIPTPVDCDDNKPCTKDSCDVAQGGCVHEDIVPCTCTGCDASTLCTEVQCVEGTCTPVPRCNKTDICYTYTGNCDLVNGCEKQFKCDDNDPCTDDTCDRNTGACNHTLKSCDDGNACTDDTCVAGNCTHTLKTCSSANKCVSVSCDEQIGCVETPLPASFCDDFNSCTNDTCIPEVGCVHTNISCDDNLPCTIDSCDPIRQCTSDLMLCANQGKCDLGTCNNGTCTYFKPDLCEDEIILAATLGTGAIIGIIIAAVVVAALVGAGLYKGVQAYNAQKDLDSQGNTNPLYESSGQYGENKLYGDYQAFK